MFVENYRQENTESIMGGGSSVVNSIPYPKISDEDWRVWNLFLPIRSVNLEQSNVARARHGMMYSLYGVPYSVTDEMHKANRFFDRIEVWRKHELEKDPIAVGLIGDERYMIARWGMEKLLPFTKIKRSVPLILAWQFVTSPVAAMASVAAIGLLTWSMLM